MTERKTSARTTANDKQKQSGTATVILRYFQWPRSKPEGGFAHQRHHGG
jgi:hypothetical protein